MNTYKSWDIVAYWKWQTFSGKYNLQQKKHNIVQMPNIIQDNSYKYWLRNSKIPKGPTEIVKSEDKQDRGQQILRG